jgi:hypothetical protein
MFRRRLFVYWPDTGLIIEASKRKEAQGSFSVRYADEAAEQALQMLETFDEYRGDLFVDDIAMAMWPQVSKTHRDPTGYTIVVIKHKKVIEDVRVMTERAATKFRCRGRSVERRKLLLSNSAWDSFRGLMMIDLLKPVVLELALAICTASLHAQTRIELYPQ